MSATTRSGDTPTTLRREAPGPRGRPLLGSLLKFRRGKLGFLQEVARFGDVARYRVATVTFYQVNHPDGVRRVLQENNRNYGKGKMTRGVLGPLLGEGLFISEGDTWLKQRRLMQPVFHRRSVATFGELMTGATLAMLDRWESSVNARTPLDVSAEMARLTLNVATEALFGSHVGREPNAIARAVTTLVEDVSFRFEVPICPPLRVPTPHNRRVARSSRDRPRNRWRRSR